MVLNSMLQILDFCGDSKPVWQLVGKVVMVLQIAIPVLIILLGTLDLGKAVLAGDDKKIDEARKILIKRVIYGVAIFFIVVIVKAVFGFVPDANTSSTCFECVAHNGNC